jgi:heme exporter protein C
MRKLLLPFMAAALLVFASAPVLIHRAPYEVTMGLVQKIFYFHVPSAIMTLVWAAVAGVASAVFLFRKSRVADY